MNKFNKGGRGGGYGNKFNDRGGRPGFSRPSFGGNRGGFGGGRRDDRGPVTMFDAVCSECSKNCRVPFRPNGDKPVFCDSCFNQRGGGREAGRVAGAAGSIMRSPENFSINDIKTQLAMLNIKLDKVIKLLTPVELNTQPTIQVSESEVKVVEPVTKKKTVKTKKTKTIK